MKTIIQEILDDLRIPQRESKTISELVRDGKYHRTLATEHCRMAVLCDARILRLVKGAFKK